MKAEVDYSDPLRVDVFLAAQRFGVVGASNDRAKYGNKVLRCYLQHRRPVVPIHLREMEVEGVAAVPDLATLADSEVALSIITPPPVTLRIVEQAAALGHRHLWMQPGAESPAVLERAAELGLQVIAGGPCLLVVLGFSDTEPHA